MTHEHGDEHEMCECGGEGACECGHDSGCECGCSCHGGFHRRFQTKAEQIVELEAYLAELKLEVQAVEERLADLKR